MSGFSIATQFVGACFVAGHLVESLSETFTGIALQIEEYGLANQQRGLRYRVEQFVDPAFDFTCASEQMHRFGTSGLWRLIQAVANPCW